MVAVKSLSSVVATILTDMDWSRSAKLSWFRAFRDLDWVMNSTRLSRGSSRGVSASVNKTVETVKSVPHAGSETILGKEITSLVVASSKSIYFSDRLKLKLVTIQASITEVTLMVVVISGASEK